MDNIEYEYRIKECIACGRKSIYGDKPDMVDGVLLKDESYICRACIVKSFDCVNKVNKWDTPELSIEDVTRKLLSKMTSGTRSAKVSGLSPIKLATVLRLNLVWCIFFLTIRLIYYIMYL